MLLLPFFLALPRRAEVRVGETVVVKVGEVVEHNLYASGANVQRPALGSAPRWLTTLLAAAVDPGGARSLRSVTASKLLEKRAGRPP